MKISPLIFCFATVTLLSSSCASWYTRYNNYMEEWKGQDEELVYKVYGPPMRNQDLRDGRKLVAYDFQSTGTEQSLYCSVNFELKDSIVMSAKYTGNLGALRKHIKGPNGPKLVE